MRKIVSFAIILTFAILFSANVYAAPAPTLFVYNDAKKECGTFRDGDEFVSYTLPQGWQTYDYQKTQVKSTQVYCDELGYKNIGSIVSYYNLEPHTLMIRPPNYPYKTTHFNYPLLIVAIIFVLPAIILAICLLAIYMVHKKALNKKQQ